MMLAEWLFLMNLTVLNDGNTPTFERGSSSSYIDITACSEGLVTKFANWRVLEEESLSLHRYIYYEVKVVQKKRKVEWRYGALDKREVAERIRHESVFAHGPWDVGACTRVLREVCKSAHTRTRVVEGKTAYWWNGELESIRKEVVILRRRLTRARRSREGLISLPDLDNRYKDRKKEFRRKIRASKREYWKNLCAKLDEDVFGDAYKIVTRELRIRPPKVDLTNQKKLEIASVLFPVATPERRIFVGPEDQGQAIAEGEIESAAERLKEKRAPGMDGIPAEAVKILVREQMDYVHRMLNNLYSSCSFPQMWKTSRLVLIPKPGKDGISSSSFRPICLLDALGKLYEAVLLGRLEKEIVRTGGLHDDQYGFRKGRSTIDAASELLRYGREANSQGDWAVVVCLDVQNAFNSAPWDRIVDLLMYRQIDLQLLRVVDSYLSEREIEVSRGVRRQTSMGVPQGSILGPTLWNILYDGLLSTEAGEEVRLIAYADDLALLVRARKEEELIRRVNHALSKVDGWMSINGLRLAPEKTEALMLVGMRRPKNISFSLRGTKITPGKTIRYLGIVLDKSLTFGPHVLQACQKAEKSAEAFSRILPNVGGPGGAKRKILAQVVNSILLYGSPIWGTAMRIGRHRRRILSTQRRMALRVAYAYHTVSTEAALVVAGLIPIPLLVEEHRRLFEAGEGRAEEQKREARIMTLDAWQREWESCTKGRWTYKLLNNVRDWVNRRHGEMNYFICQLLTGHGSFSTYRRKIGKTEEDLCIYCGEVDSPEHAFFACSRWEAERLEIAREIGKQITVENLVDTMIQNERYWKILAKCITKVISTKERDMRERWG